ncbi:hypothetical protein CQ044_16630 [Microbacterium sp. MYb64]|nr:hypothetical protein CQ044_16630 [Microbacterium sp. MYb64]
MRMLQHGCLLMMLRCGRGLSVMPPIEWSVTLVIGFLEECCPRGRAVVFGRWMRKERDDE